METSSPRAKQARRATFWMGLVILCIGLLFEVLRQPIAADGLLRVRFLDVGQGDAILIDTPTGEHVLVDGGPDGHILTLLDQFLVPPRTFKVVVASHNHADHITGLRYVLGDFPVETVWLSGAVHTSDTYRRWLEAIKDSGTQARAVHRGEVRSVGSTEFRVLHPIESFEGTTPNHQHDATIVLKMSYGATSFLLTGDLELGNELDLLANDRAALRADVLKVSHQGSKGSSTARFLEAVDPDYAVISVGVDNKFGHPHQEALDRLNALDIPLYRTDQDGTVTCTSNGISVNCESER